MGSPGPSWRLSLPSDEGEDLRLSARGLTGAALAKKERVVHLGAFCVGEGAGSKSGTDREV
jgi:hypothetical protein